jgi:hypothetical protein
MVKSASPTTTTISVDQTMTPLRKIKRFARRDLHAQMQVPAVYLATRSAQPVIVHVRLHNKFDRAGDVKGARMYPGEIENISPKIIFDLSEITPVTGAVVSFEPGEAYNVDHLLPNDDTYQTASVTRLLEGPRSAGLPVPSEDGQSVILAGDLG